MFCLSMSVCIIAVIQVTLSQFTYDAIQQHSDTDSCERNEQLLSQLTSAVSQLQKTVSRLESHITGTVRNTGDTNVSVLSCVNIILNHRVDRRSGT